MLSKVCLPTVIEIKILHARYLLHLILSHAPASALSITCCVMLFPTKPELLLEDVLMMFSDIGVGVEEVEV